MAKNKLPKMICESCLSIDTTRHTKPVGWILFLCSAPIFFLFWPLGLALAFCSIAFCNESRCDGCSKATSMVKVDSPKGAELWQKRYDFFVKKMTAERQANP